MQFYHVNCYYWPFKRVWKKVESQGKVSEKSGNFDMDNEWQPCFFSETAWPIKAKFYVEPPWVRGTKVYSRHPGHMTKMAATPIYVKNPSKIFSGTSRPISTKLGMKHRGLLPTIVYSNVDPGLALTYFMARSNL